MPLYHATRRRRLPNILGEGLHSEAEQNFGCERGVYLADNPIIAFGFLIEHFLDNADENSKPSKEVEDFIVIVIDDSRIDKSQLFPDPNVEGQWQQHLFIYHGTIDVTAMPILDADILFPENHSN